MSHAPDTWSSHYPDTSPNYTLCLNANEQLTSFKFTMSQPGFQTTTCHSRNRSSHCPLQIGATELSREKMNIWSSFVKRKRLWTFAIVNNFTTIFKPLHDKTNKMTCAPSEDSDQPRHPPSLIRVFAVRSMGSWRPKVSSCGQRRPWSD